MSLTSNQAPFSNTIARQTKDCRSHRPPLWAALMLSIVGFSLTLPAVAVDEVNVYSYRKPELVKPLFDAFTDQTGISVNLVSAKKGLVERLKQEGANSPADLVFTVDIGRLTDTKNEGLSQAVNSDVLTTNIPAQYRDPDGHWFGLTTRARIIVSSRERVGEGEILDYEDLASTAMKGRVCTRSGKHAYMVALTASMLAHSGRDSSEAWLRGLKDNLARKPQGNDRAQVKAIKEGECDVALINTYYMGNMMEDPEQRAWADAVNVIFPNQDNRGAHMNVSGMALTMNAPNRDNAIKLMEYLSSEAAQQIYAEQNHEYPVKDGVPWSDIVRSFGEFMPDSISLSEIAAFRREASKLADIVDFDGS